jgi:hypothetical protein
VNHIAVFALALLAALLQVAVLPVIEPQPLAMPLLPVALVAGWCAMRGANETWSVLLLAPLVAGVLSEARVAWFLLALVPAVALGAALTPSVERRRPPGVGHRLLVAAAVAAGGTIAHAAILAITTQATVTAAEAAGHILGATAWTVLLAIAFALLLWPLRPRSRGLFA